MFRFRLSASALAMALAATALPAPSAANDPATSASSEVPPQRPNVLIWMVDDVGFAQMSCFGGLVQTPNIDSVAARGLRYTNYHTAPICSASRAAMLMGRNPHSVHVGGHSGAPLPYPGYDSEIPPEDGTIAANLKQDGYITFALGKWDHLPSEEMTPAGPFNRWPTGQGFDKFYGFLGAEADNWHPALIQDTSPVRHDDGADYLLNQDLADRAIAMINSRSALGSRPPFFMYFATGTDHAPHHAPKVWIDRYKGKFDMGWDKARQTILERQIAQGLVPAGTKLAPRPEGMPAWDSLSADQKRLYARQMEVFAAALSYADEQFGRILDDLRKNGELDNTAIAIATDNGASSEGAYSGTYNEVLFMNGHFASYEENMPFIDKWGGPETQPHYALGWAVAGNTPFRYYKQTTYEGGVHVPFIVSWPNGIAAHGELRKQFVDVDDVAPTILDITGAPLARIINNVEQKPMEGISFRYTFNDPKAADRKDAQYFEMYGNKGLWSNGWTIVTAHRLDPWRMDQTGAIKEPWELYDVAHDPGQTTNLAAKYPEKVQRLAQLFDRQAQQFHVYPISNIGDSRELTIKDMQSEIVRRHGIWAFPGPISHIGYGAVPPISVRPFRMTMKVGLSTGHETGPLFALGGATGGIGLYLDNGVPTFVFRDLAGKETLVVAKGTLPVGTSALSLDVQRTISRPMEPTPTTITITLGDKTIANETLSLAIPPAFGVSETFDIGNDWGSTVTNAYAEGTTFPGRISNVEFRIE